MTLLVVAQGRQPILDHIQDRPLSWDPYGIVRIQPTAQATNLESKWITKMKQGDYSDVFRDAAHKARQDAPSFLQVWILTECTRKTGNITALHESIADIQKLYPNKPIAVYAQLKLNSLSYALCLKPPVDSKRLEEASASLKNSWNLALPFSTDYLPLGVAMTHVEVEATLRKREIVAGLIQKNPSATDLLLWESRAYINGRVSRLIDAKTGKPKLDAQGRPIFNLNWPDAPDYTKALEFLNSFEKKVPGEPLVDFYKARIESAKAYFTSMSNSETKELTEKAKQRLSKFLSMPGIPRPLAKIAETFGKLPYPGTFVTTPTE